MKISLISASKELSIPEQNVYENVFLRLAWDILFILLTTLTGCWDYDAELYSKISALVNLARKLDTYNEQN